MLTPFRDAGRLNSTPLPPLVRVRRRLDPPRVADLPAAVRAAVQEAGLHGRIRPGMSIALGIGSRGIRHIDRLAAATVRALEDLGAAVFVVPAMGSHGAATAEGQREVLARLGVSEENLGVPVRATMEVDLLGTLPEGMPVYMDRLAHAADGIVVLGRTKPHTDFRGPIESGAGKMVAVGLGKREGAAAMHSFGAWGLRELMPRAARLAVEQGPVLGAIQVLENANDEPAVVAGLAPEDIAGPREAQLQQQAKDLLGRLPFKELDVLVVDLMGKDISGTGMDSNVLGRLMVRPQLEPESPSFNIVAVLDLTEITHGNAIGIGLADVTTWRVWEKADLQTTYINCLTAGITGVQRAKLPMAFANSRQAIAAALRMCGHPDPRTARLARIRSTLHLTEFLATETALAGLDAGVDLERLTGPEPWAFDEQGELAPL